MRSVNAIDFCAYGARPTASHEQVSSSFRHDSLAGKLLQIHIQIKDAPSLVGAGLPAIVRLLTIRPARRAGGGFLGLAVMR